MEATLNGPFGRTTLGPGPIAVGRTQDNQLSLNDPQVSSHHAEIRPEGQGFSIVDRGSTNGTFVNEQRIDSNVPRMLNPGDRVRIGGTTFTYEVSGGSSVAPTILASPAQGGFSPSYNPPPSPYAPGYNAGAPQPPSYPQQPPSYPQQPPSYPQQPPASYPQQPQQYPGQPVPAVPGAFPNYNQPVQQRKKSRAGCWIGLVILLLLIGGAVAFAFSPYSPPALKGLLGGSTPDKTGLAYCNALKNKDYPTAYDQLSSRGKKQFTEPQFEQAAKLLSLVGGITNCAIGNVQINGSTATAVLTITTGNGQTKPETDKYVLENGTWKFDGAAR